MHYQISTMIVGIFIAALVIRRIVRLVNGDSLKSINQLYPGEQPAGLLVATSMLVLIALDQQDLWLRSAAVTAAIAAGSATTLMIVRDLRKWRVKPSQNRECASDSE